VNKKYVLKNKRRFCTFIIVMVVLLITVLFIGTSYGYKPTENIQHSVQPGDTLWNIAQQYNPNGDVRKTVYEIKKLNNLTTSDIYAGETLVILEE
jgi:uncharacterized membrane protein